MKSRLRSIFVFTTAVLWVLRMEAPVPIHAGVVYLETGWENGQAEGVADRVLYSKDVAGFFNSSNPPPECSRRYREIVRIGDYSLMIAGYSRADYSFCYYRVFDLNLNVVPGMKIGYWIYHAQGTPKIAVDGHFADGNTIRDFGGGVLRDQLGVRIHPAHRQDPMNQWHYVEVDLSPAVGKKLTTLLFAFDNGGDKFKGPYRAYVDELKIFKEDPPVICRFDVPEASWKGEYFNNIDLTGTPVMVRNDGDGALAFDWGLASPAEACGVPADRFSVRWTRKVNFSPGIYEFAVTADDGVRLWIDGALKLDRWVDQSPTEYKVGPIFLSGDHNLRMDYYENRVGAVAKLSWEKVYPRPITGTILFEKGWEEKEFQGFQDRVEYSKGVSQGQSRSQGDMAFAGHRSLMIAGVSQSAYAYSYHRLFNLEIPVKAGLKLGYWIYHAQGTPKIAIDGNFTDGETFRDLEKDGNLTDQYGIRIHPAWRQDPMNQWHYVEVDLSKAEGKVIDSLMVAFDNGADGFIGPYRAYVDDLKIYYPSVQSLTQGKPTGSLGMGRQISEATEPETWRSALDFYGHVGFDDFGPQVDACGAITPYALAFHQDDLIEYLMKFGGEFNRLTLRGIASSPGPVKMEIYIDGDYRTTASFDADHGCNQDVTVTLPGIPFGIHAIAVKFVNDYADPSRGIDRNLYLAGLRASRNPGIKTSWAFPVGEPSSGAGWYMTNGLGASFTDWYSGHLGEDWAIAGDSAGQPVFAASAGRVITVRPNCGNYLDVVVIEHQVEGMTEPIYSFYGHIEADGFVKEGDWVDGRQQIGIVGDPRPSFEPHLHFEIKNRTALLNPPFSPCTDMSRGWYISAGYSRIRNDYNNSKDYYDPSDSVQGNRYYHPRRFIEGNRKSQD
jgi:hypothetical protein